MRTKSVINETYNFKVIFYKECSYLEALKHFSKKFKVEFREFGEGETFGCYWWIGSHGVGGVWVEYGDRFDRLISLVHECLHITSRSLNRLDIELTPDTEEVYTYLQGWLLSKGLKFYGLAKERK